MAAGTKVRPTVHVLSRIPDLADSIRARNDSITVINIPLPDADVCDSLSSSSLHQAQEAEVMVADPGLIASLGMIHRLRGLNWMQGTWAGVDKIMKNLDKAETLPTYKLTRFGGYFGAHMAEYVCGQIISHERKFAEILNYQKEKSWKQKEFSKYRLLSQLTLGIIGAGDIGKDVAAAAKSFGMKVIGVGRRDIPPEKQSPHFNEYKVISSLPEVLASSDYVCNILPSTETTRDLFSGEMLAHCKNKQTVFINVGRGDVIDEFSLLRALKEGWISHAILDVCRIEPLPESSQLWHHPNVTITPHVSAISFGWQAAELFLENYERYINDQPLKYLVKWDEGY